MKDKKYYEIVNHYESCLEKYGNSHLGVDWPKIEDVYKRYEVMLDVIKVSYDENVKVLDFGCGASHLYEYIQEKEMNNIEYYGLEISEKFLNLSKEKFPNITYFLIDILEDDSDLPNFDYIIMNGVFTEKVTLTFQDMFEYFKNMIKKVFRKANKGITFNTMSKHVDWEREDLFHLPFDLLADFLKKEISRHFIIRNDYGLYEYTVYIYKEPQVR